MNQRCDDASIRPATLADVDEIRRFDHMALTSPSRAEFIARSARDGHCYVAARGAEAPLAYGVLEYTFYDSGFIAMLYVSQPHRRRGLGERLVRHMEGACRTPKLFTSTNESNHAMRALLAKLEYRPSGRIENLDEGDPELVFFKLLSAVGQAPVA